jgi:hypothetical protein
MNSSMLYLTSTDIRYDIIKRKDNFFPQTKTILSKLKQSDVETMWAFLGGPWAEMPVNPNCKEMMKLLFFAAFIVSLAYSMKIGTKLYYAGSDCEDNNGLGAITFTVWTDISINVENCTNLVNYLYAKSTKTIMYEMDHFPSLAEAVPSKSQYYTVYT